jgi:hypothetical protein
MEGCGFASTVWAKQANSFTPLQFKRYVADNTTLVKTFSNTGGDESTRFVDELWRLFTEAGLAKLIAREI